MSVEIFVFSYNRGNYLRNCVESISRFMPFGNITVFDDNSDDKSTREILASLAKYVKVISPSSQSGGRLGGLYENMQTALDGCSPSDLMIAIQDDMQFVRKFGQDEIKYIETYFDINKSAALIYPSFFKGSGVPGGVEMCGGAGCLWYELRGTVNGVGEYYSDVVIANCNRLKAANWRFGHSESDNAAKASQLFGRMGYMRNPVMMYLPEVPIYRSRGLTLAARLASWIVGSTPNNYIGLDHEQEVLLADRPLDYLATAEEFLELSRPPKREPFVYSAVEIWRPIESLHYMQLKIEKIVRRVIG
jgi:glycosyltransferase involved in cell wall biosynthesis